MYAWESKDELEAMCLGPMDLQCCNLVYSLERRVYACSFTSFETGGPGYLMRSTNSLGFVDPRTKNLSVEDFSTATA